MSPSADAAIANPQAGASVSCDAANVQGVSPSTPPPSNAVTIDKSLLICSPVRSSDLTRVLQQRRQERKEMLNVVLRPVFVKCIQGQKKGSKR